MANLVSCLNIISHISLGELNNFQIKAVEKNYFSFCSDFLFFPVARMVKGKPILQKARNQTIKSIISVAQR